RYKHDVLIRDRCCSQPRRLVILDLLFPKLSSTFGLDGVEPAGLIAEKKNVTLSQWHREHCGSNRSLGLELPLCASRLGAQRIDDTAGGSDKEVVTENGRLCESIHVAIESEGPAQLELRDLIGSQAGSGCRLKPCVSGCRAPSVPLRFGALVDFD